MEGFLVTEQAAILCPINSLESKNEADDEAIVAAIITWEIALAVYHKCSTPLHITLKEVCSLRCCSLINKIIVSKLNT